MPKMVVLKPILWNSSGYMGPDGQVTSSGYADDHGYGHEEWNGRDDWVWRGWRVFDTQSQPRLHEYAGTGDLGIIMITIVDGLPCVVGIACNVYDNSAADQKAIAKELKLKANGSKVWALSAVKERFDDRAAFNKHWSAAYNCVRWRCPVTHYQWMRDRVYFEPNDLVPRDPPRGKVVAMHSSYQSVDPQRALALLSNHLPPSHPIIGWLSDGEFDIFDGGKKRSANAKTKKIASAGTPVDPFTRYLQEYELLVTPKHHMLQQAFEQHLKKVKAMEIEPDVERVDIRFQLPGRGLILAEIKPTELTTVRFAIRSAMGQLLDYRQKVGEKVNLLVVISGEPESKDDLALALENGFGLAWQTKTGFEMRWPGSSAG